jgi:predicted TIM-barrel fold metal-dependent hydrolase
MRLYEAPNAQNGILINGMVSADSHVVEPPECYKDFIDPKYRDDVPFLRHDEKMGDCYIIKGFQEQIPVPQSCSAGVNFSSKEKGRLWEGVRFHDLHRGGWDPLARLPDQDRDGVVAEILYPTIGMVLCGLSDPDYKNACMWAYNRWLQGYCSAAPDRLFGLGATAIRSVSEAVEDLRKFKEMGFRGAMLPGDPATVEDYDDPSFDPLWEAAVALDMPLSFHILTGGQRNQHDSLRTMKVHRGPFIGIYMTYIRALQDIIGMFIFGRVFERHPKLKIVLVESDAGWAPHWMSRADHAYHRLNLVTGFGEMERSPSQQFKENVYLTFGDDWSALNNLDGLNIDNLLWANDYPHTDALWPDSQATIARFMMEMPEPARNALLLDNTTKLYNLPQGKLSLAA